MTRVAAIVAGRRGKWLVIAGWVVLLGLAGTMIVRMTKVSSRMLSATMKPRSRVKVTGRVISTENVPARMIPALVITGPVADRARSVPSRVPCRRASSRTLELIGDRIWWPSTAGKGGVLREEIDEPEPEPART